MKVKLQNVRLAFPQLFEARTINGEGEPAFSCAFLLEPNHPSVKDINAAIVKVAQEKWGAKADVTLKSLRTADKVCLHDGNTKAEYAGYEGNLFVNARNKVRPLVIDRDKNPLTPQSGKPYAGCYVNASIEVWAQDNTTGKRVNASLSGVQFFRDGDAFAGGQPASADEFDDLGVDETADALV